MRVLCVPNWSFAREGRLSQQFTDILREHDGAVHYAQGDLDHNRTVTAFSGEASPVADTLFRLAESAFGVIDLNRHTGVHPRIGALDVCPFVLLDETPLDRARTYVEEIAEGMAECGLPIFLYEKSERGRHEADLPTLRKGGFGALLERDLQPDFGPNRCHPRLGVTVMGIRPFLIAMNVNLASENLTAAQDMARRIRVHRMEGDLRFLGVRSLGLRLASRHQVQVSMNLTLPDSTPVDPILEWVQREAGRHDLIVAENELIGVIRERDVRHATRLPIRPEQIV